MARFWPVIPVWSLLPSIIDSDCSVRYYIIYSHTIIILKCHDLNAEFIGYPTFMILTYFIYIYFILGFLNANPTPHLRARVANYGLMDQIAALHWVQQNIELFGGDPSSVTLLGHGSGAACINFLMISPTVMPGKECL